MGIQFDELGREIPDPRPLAVAPGTCQPESIQSMLERLVRNHLSRQAVDEGNESFDEANDFEVDDEDFDDPLTKYEEMGLEVVESEDPPGSSGEPLSVSPSEAPQQQEASTPPSPPPSLAKPS